MEGPPDWSRGRGAEHDARLRHHRRGLPKPACTRVARMASAGIARAVDPVFSDVDGDVAFCLASGPVEHDRFAAIAVGTAAATVTAEAIRDAVAQAT